MSVIKAFRALRPRADMARQVSSVPYDVVYESEVRDHVGTSRTSFLRVTRADADFASDERPSPHDVFARARENLDWFIREKIYAVDPTPSLYVYRLSTPSHTQTGLVGCCSLDEYERGLIKKHERVRPDKVGDRTGHLLAVRAQTGLIFLAFRGTPLIHELFEAAIRYEPLYDFTSRDEVRHTVWQIDGDTGPWIDAFAELPALYIADGHHRIESALEARNELRRQNGNGAGDEEYNYVVAGMFPAEDLQIMAYNRVVKGLNGLAEDTLIEKLRADFAVTESAAETEPRQHGEFCMYFAGRWYRLTPNEHVPATADPIERLDVSILQRCILGPVLGVGDARTDERLGFVGGKRGTAELERMVDDGEVDVAFSMFATTMDDLLSVSDRGEIMPPKSTWFEPKLKDGLLVHKI